MIRKKRTVIAALFLAIFAGLGGYASYRLYIAYAAYAEGSRVYTQIARQVISEDYAPESEESATDAANDASAKQSTEISQIEIPQRSVNFAALKEINSDSIGWIYCPDTVIDYPVMKAEDYTYYLRHLPDGTYNINGSLFLDYGCEPDFSSRLSVIYGHNMKNDTMFGTLVEYKNQSYFEAHPYLYLYTETENYRIAPVYGAVVSASQWINGSFASDADSLLSYAEKNTTFHSSEKISEEDRIMVLSTCSYEYDDARYIVVGKLQPQS